jgi:predicted heme/steroid binding protein
MIKVGDLVRINGSWGGILVTWEGQVGIVTKAPMTERGRWAILLTSGQLIATMHGSALEVINGKES